MQSLGGCTVGHRTLARRWRPPSPACRCSGRADHDRRRPHPRRPITIAYITDLTGEGGSENSTSPAGFDARIAMQNAEGGVNGHKLVPLVIDDQTNPSEIATAVQEADSKAFGIVSQSPLFFLAAKYPNQAGVPVTGTYDDGPEWGTQPYTNMFASDEGSVNPEVPRQHADRRLPQGARRHGARRVRLRHLAVVEPGRHRRPPTRSSTPGARSASSTPPCPSAAWRSPAPRSWPSRTASTRWCRPWTPTRTTPWPRRSSRRGSSSRRRSSPPGYEPDVINSPAWRTLQGDYFLSLFRPWSLPNAGTQQMQAAMEKYAHFTKSQFPNFGQYEAWAGADLMIKGLQMAGPNPTRAAVIKDLRSAEVLQRQRPAAPEHQLLHDLRARPSPKQCTWVMQAEKTGFKAISSQPFCGTDIPGTSTATSS